MRDGRRLRGIAKKGWRTSGLDVSPEMVDRSRRRCPDGDFVVCDATSGADFATEASVVLCLTDSVNHFDSWPAVRAFIDSSYGACSPGGTLVFDVLTPRGLQDRAGFSISDHDGFVVISYEVFDPTAVESHSTVMVFIRRHGGVYERADLGARRSAFGLPELLDACRDAGFEQAHIAPTDAPATVLDPEAAMHDQERVFVVAQRPA